MEVVLKRPEVRQFVEEQVKGGAFASPSEVIEIALLRLMLNDTDEEFDEATVEAVKRADEQISRGQGRDLKDFAAEFRARHQAHLGKSNA